jgi:hypothetical protein
MLRIAGRTMRLRISAASFETRAQRAPQDEEIEPLVTQ